MLDIASWRRRVAPADVERHARALEAGGVLVLPQLAFRAVSGRDALPRRSLVGRQGEEHQPRRTGDQGRARRRATSWRRSRRWSRASRPSATALVGALFPRYAPHLLRARTSYPAAVGAAGRAVSWRKDDSRLHVDAFPSRPNRGERILRVFCNVNPNGEDRVWRVGETFEAMARTAAAARAVDVRG